MTKVFQAAVQRRLPLLALSVIVLLASGCAVGPKLVTPEPPPIPDGGPPVPETNEVVLSDNTQLVADAPFGPIKIEAGPGLRRVFTWNDVRRGAVVEPRESRFAGSMGITYDGQPPVWQPAEGVTQLEYEEGQRRFENMDDATIWMQIRRLHYVYNNSGIVVGWQQNGDTLKVELWQFYIDGKQPTSMPNADDSAITISPLEVVPQKMAPVLVFADGHTEPYTEEAANKYKPGAGSSSPAPTSCNWFQRTFTDCSAKLAAAKKAEAEAEAQAKAEAEAAAAAARAAAAKPKTPPAPTHPSATISGSTVNIREGSTTKSKVLFQAKEGDSVKILKKEKDWSYVQFDDDRKGWVADFLLKK
ncbi:SH3 domain-containing protein [Salinisphaera sp. T31B1]|uniref:SH3 domain-containing protein n=1 Tax=Salinisphaera sp. T31B1 TaxID=727963 RepID=UPI00333F869A